MENISLKELDELGLYIEEQDRLIKEEKQKLTERQKELEKHKEKMIAFMVEHEKKTYPVGKFKFTVTDRFTFQTPKGEDAIKFFDWCVNNKGEDYVKNTFKMHSQSLQTFANTEIDNALAIGNIDFKIDGLGEKKLLQTLSIRRA